MHPLIRAVCLATCVLALGNAPSHAAETIAKFSGSESTRTRIFEVDGPWLLDWRLNSNYRRQLGFELRLLDGDTGRFDSWIFQRRRSVGNGLKLFSEPGRYRFEIVASFADWQLEVIELTEDEAAEYTAAE